MGGEDGQARVGQRAEEHQHVAVLALAADLVGVDARGLVAVVAVGDQQLGVGQRGLERGDQLRVADAPERLSVPSSSVAVANGSSPVAPRERLAAPRRRGRGRG